MLEDALREGVEARVHEALAALLPGRTVDTTVARVALAFAKEKGAKDAAQLLEAEPRTRLARLALLGGLGGAPADALLAHPEDLDALGGFTLDALPAATLPPAERLAALRALRRRHSLATAGAELDGSLANRAAARSLSDAADALIDSTLAACRDELAERFPAVATLSLAVLALGKLGGRELNYSSDVDLVLVRGDDAPNEAAEALARSFVRALEESAPEGRLYRVDLRLRPQGSTGALAPRAKGAREYYERTGRTWERQAFIKARACAGDRDLGTSFLAAIEPFIWTARLDAKAIEEINALRAKIEAKAGERNVKEGPGGIRDVEFCVQFLQLLNGADARVRATGTLDAIERLEKANVVRAEEAATLREAYGFLRRVEHVLQLTRDRELKQVPADAAARERLACALGLELGAFDARLASERARARRTLDALLRKPFAAATKTSERLPRAASERLVKATGSGDPEEAARASALLVRDLVLGGASSDPAPALRALGFRDTDGVKRALDSLASERSLYLAPSGRARTLLAGLAPRLLAALGRAPDPDGALRNLERATATLGAKATFYELLLENQDALELFCALAAASDFLVETLARRPGVFDEVVDRLLTGTRPSHDEIVEEARVALAREDGTEALRDVRAVHLLLIGIRDVSGRANAQNTGRDLAVLAESILEALLEKARATVAAKHGGEPARATGGSTAVPASFAALALGKLGAYELSYSSDLDLLFVLEGHATAPDGTTAEVFFEAVAREAVRLGEGPASAEGPLYPIDLRLRPAGGKGSLAVTLDAARRYYAGEGPGERAADWERLALQKLRPTAGDRAFAERAARVLQDELYARRYPDLHRAVREMREKQIEAAGADHLKRGRGGLADIEFLASALALEHGRDRPALRETNTARLLTALRDASLLGPTQHLELMTAYQFLRRVELRLRVALARPDSKVSPGERRALALRLGYVDAATTAEAQLAKELDYNRKRVRAIFSALMSDA